MPAMKWYTWALAADVYAVLRLAGVAGILPENDFFTAKAKMIFGSILLIVFFLLWIPDRVQGESLVERLKENRIMTAMFVAAIVLIYVGILIPA